MVSEQATVISSLTPSNAVIHAGAKRLRAGASVMCLRLTVEGMYCMYHAVLV